MTAQSTKQTLTHLNLRISGGASGPCATSEAAQKWRTFWSGARAPFEMAQRAVEKIGKLPTEQREDTNMEDLTWSLSETVAHLLKNGYYATASDAVDRIRDASVNGRWEFAFETIEGEIFGSRDEAYEKGVIYGAE